MLRRVFHPLLPLLAVLALFAPSCSSDDGAETTDALSVSTTTDEESSSDQQPFEACESDAAAALGIESDAFSSVLGELEEREPTSEEQVVVDEFYSCLTPQGTGADEVENCEKQVIEEFNLSDEDVQNLGADTGEVVDPERQAAIDALNACDPEDLGVEEAEDLTTTSAVG